MAKNKCETHNVYVRLTFALLRMLKFIDSQTEVNNENA